MPTQENPRDDAGVVKAAPEPVMDEAALEQQVKERRAARERKEAGETDDSRNGSSLIKAIADGEEFSEEEAVDAMEWFLSPEDERFTHTISINVGSPTKAKWIDWEIQPVDLDTLKKIREKSQGGGSRQQRRRNQASGDIDEVEANLAIVVEGTVTPDLREIANQMRLVDPGDALRRKFAHKPGLLGQLSGEIMSISGYDDEDVREVDAAKNS
jgi:hypothetical protein